ncbi:hypothetical protein CBM2591_A320107 [Cupriavidus taiwanensis]|nr:hypothetical protein CBM2591_A320107 [Cupriavidus taiwanensis]SOZ90338.1 hypothetical protein CBM2621_A280010 [Cupriavidus taiwanensis]
MAPAKLKEPDENFQDNFGGSACRC